MKPTRLLRRAIAAFAVLAALAVPAGVSAYPVIGDEPGSTAAERAGHDWMAQRRQRLETLAANTAPRPVRICQVKKAKLACVKP